VTAARRRAGRSARLRRTRRIILGLAAATLLLALVAGPPLLIATAYGPGGFPLPPTDLDLTGPLSDTALVDLLAATLLLAWLRWLACTAVEAAAVVHGHGLPGRLPLLTGWEQIVARRLVTAALGLLTSAGPLAPTASALAAPPAAAAPPHPVTAAAPAPAGVHHSLLDQPPGLPDPAADRLPPPAPHRPGQADRAGLKRYVVQFPHDGSHDSLWSIAARYLGDGFRYTEIYALNKDRTQPDGHRLALPRLVRPGWELLLPADATGLPDAPQADPAARPDHVVVAAGDTLSSIAARYLGDPNRYPEIFALNAGRAQPDGSRLTDPDRILPGLHLRLAATHPVGGGSRPTPTPAPRRPAPAPPPQPPPHRPSPGRTPPAPTSPPATPTPHQSPGQPPGPAHPAATRQPWTKPAWIATGTLLATSLAGLVGYRRRRRDAKVRPGQTVPPPDPTLARLHTALLVVAQDPAGVERVDAALRMLAALHTATPTPTHAPVPQVLLRRPDGTLDVFLRDPATRPPAPWTATAGGRIWTLPPDATVTRPDLPPPCPALVQLGTTDDGAELYTDLEALGVLAIDAAGADLRTVARAVTATLAVSPLAELVRIRAVGFDPYGLADEERLTTEPSVEDLLEHAAADLTHTTRALTRTGLPGTFALRARDTDENWDPTVAVVGSQPLTDPAAARLAELAGAGGHGLAAIAPDSPSLGARWHLVPEPTQSPDADLSATRPGWRLDPLGIHLNPLRLAADELADLSALLTQAAAPADDAAADDLHPDEFHAGDLRTQDLPAEDPRAEETNGGSHRTRSEADENSPDLGGADPKAGAADLAAAAASSDRDRPGPRWAVMVRLLGPVDVVDRAGRAVEGPVRDRTLQVLAWLVTHRTGGSRIDLETAIWPSGAKPGTVQNELSRARRLLTDLAGPAARDWIPAGQVTLDRPVVSDLEILRAHLTVADRHPHQPEVAIQALQAGLDLVRGVPARYPWLDAEVGSTLTTLPIATAVRLAELLLQRGDIDGVLTAAARGLTILPAHTELFALRMRAAAANGDRAAVKAEYEAYLRAEQADPLWDGETDQDLLHLYQQLLHPRPRRGG